MNPSESPSDSDSRHEREIEALLGRFTPADPGADLMRRLRAANPDLEDAAAARRIVPLFRRFSIPLITAAAACIAGAMLLPRPAASPPQSTATNTPPASGTAPVKIPIESRQHLMEVTNLGVANDADNRPVRLVRTTWVDEIYYQTVPGNERSMESRVREEVLPVVVNTY
ncbi:MAG: hypothetical protein QM755_03165 [Luteolibacter sp.]